jgi:hypothetical protein
MILKSKLKIAASLLPAYLLGLTVYAYFASNPIPFEYEGKTLYYSLPFWQCFGNGAMCTILIALMAAVVFGAVYLPYRVITGLRLPKTIV